MLISHRNFDDLVYKPNPTLMSYCCLLFSLTILFKRHHPRNKMTHLRPKLLSPINVGPIELKHFLWRGGEILLAESSW